MKSKVYAAIHAVLTAGLFCRLVVSGTVGEFNSFGFLIVACATVAVGCWKHWRWMVELGALPIPVLGACRRRVASMYNTNVPNQRSRFSDYDRPARVRAGSCFLYFSQENAGLRTLRRSADPTLDPSISSYSVAESSRAVDFADRARPMAVIFFHEVVRTPSHHD
jgi:hypothetical protein